MGNKADMLIPINQDYNVYAMNFKDVELSTNKSIASAYNRLLVWGTPFLENFYEQEWTYILDNNMYLLNTNNEHYKEYLRALDYYISIKEPEKNIKHLYSNINNSVEISTEARNFIYHIVHNYIIKKRRHIEEGTIQ